MPAVNFRENRQNMGPSWLVHDGADAELAGYVLELLRDAFVERLRQGLLARLPQNDRTGQTTAADDALAAMGRDRRIVRGINESSQTYAQRLVRWLDDWRTAGNPFALMAQLAGYCGLATGPGVAPGTRPSFRTVDVRGNWFSRAADGTLSVSLKQANWDWDGSPTALANWSRFWVIIYPNGLWSTGPRWGDAGINWGQPNNRTWGSTATTDEVASVKGIVADWKPAGTTCVNIILAFDNSSFNPFSSVDTAGLPDSTWGKWHKVAAGVSVPSRLSTARYWDGV